jgi:hypothetical protein
MRLYTAVFYRWLMKEKTNPLKIEEGALMVFLEAI